MDSFQLHLTLLTYKHWLAPLGHPNTSMDLRPEAPTVSGPYWTFSMLEPPPTLAARFHPLVIPTLDIHQQCPAQHDEQSVIKEGKSLASLATNLLIQSRKSKSPTALILQ